MGGSRSARTIVNGGFLSEILESVSSAAKPPESEPITSEGARSAASGTRNFTPHRGHFAARPTCSAPQRMRCPLGHRELDHQRVSSLLC